jgi:nicotinate-nucleotide adenylyltransferase
MPPPPMAYYLNPENFMVAEEKIGIYGGTFDPIHFGHLNLAIEIMEFHGLDEVWFCPAQKNPHKQEIQSASPEHRLKMLEIALGPLPQFKIITLELQRSGPSYTIDTLRNLKAGEKNTPHPRQFFLIMGEDSVQDFFSWREPQEILRLAPPLIAKRFVTDQTWEALKGDPEIKAALLKGLTPTHIMEISATLVRQRIHQGLYVGHWVPAKVVDYIYQNQLYYTQ